LPAERFFSRRARGQHAFGIDPELPGRPFAWRAQRKPASTFEAAGEMLALTLSGPAVAPPNANEKLPPQSFESL